MDTFKLLKLKNYFVHLITGTVTVLFGVGILQAIVLEMLVYSDEGFIKLLPAVPGDLSKGNLEGMWLYTFAKIEKMSWDMEAGKAEVEIFSMEDQVIYVSFPVGYKELRVNGKLYDKDGNGADIEFKKNTVVHLEYLF